MFRFGVTKSEHKCNKMETIQSIKILSGRTLKKFLESLFGKEGEKNPSPKPIVSGACLKKALWEKLEELMVPVKARERKGERR